MKEDGKQTGRMVSLNRIWTVTVIAAYIAILVLLLWMDSILVLNYRRERTAEEQQKVSSYADTVSEHLGKIDELLYDIYAYSEDFRGLNGVQKELEEFNSVYEIDLIMRNRAALYGWIDGYMLSYHGMNMWRYYIGNRAGDLDFTDQMKQYVSERIHSGENWDRSVARIGNRTYYFILCRRENVALCGIYDLNQSVQSYTGDTEIGKDVFFADGSRIYGVAEGADGSLAAGADSGPAEKAAGDPTGEVLPESVGGLSGEPDAAAEQAGGIPAAQLLARVNGANDNFEEKIGSDEYFGKRIDGTQLWVIYRKPVTVFTFMNAIHMLLFLLTFSTVIVAVFLYRYMKKNMILPLRSLVGTMNEVSRGNWDSVHSHGSRLEEVQRVDEAFSVMVSEIRKQKILSYEQTIEKQNAQMQYLQLQLKPHFYLNGLKTLNMLAMEGNMEKAQDLIMHLSFHLRYLLQVNRTLVPLASEIDYTKNYGSIQSKMYGRDAAVSWDIQEGVGDVPVPTLCIQTFVENSFKYAMPDGGWTGLEIAVKIHKLETEDGDFVDISVSDNGVGYPPHILEDINGAPKEESVSVGINNLKRRCIFLYGDRCEYNFCNSDGAVSELVLPCSRG